MGVETGSGFGDQSVASRAAEGDTVRRARGSDRVAAIAGLAYALLTVADFFTPDTPSSSDSVERLAATLTRDRAGHQWSLMIEFLADIALFVLLAGLWSRLRRWERPGGMLTGLFAIGAAAFLSLILVSQGFYLALVQAAETSSEASALPALSALDNFAGAAILPAGVVMFLGAAAAILSTRALPAWLGWLAALTAVLLVVSLAGVFEDGNGNGTDVLGWAGFVGYLLTIVWVLAASVTLLMRAGLEPKPVA